ncbi:uncharacterized protein LOC123700795 [Colias croceus]|uniref:uncharacterized protein LOC123700795 n=1 Tax=Colias crocea TaxID=72248 RepID=UPI001E27A885|nr:uncharacterized protein LOC123700795 [Colias croceus]
MKDPPDPLNEGSGLGPGPSVASYVIICSNDDNFDKDLLDWEQEGNRKRKRGQNIINTINSLENLDSGRQSVNSNSNSVSAKENISVDLQSNSLIRNIYTEHDSYPFVVHVQRCESSPGDGSTLHPITFGNFLKKNSFKNIVAGSVKRIGRNRCVVAFSTAHDANTFINNKALETFNLRAKIPSFHVSRIGLVRGIPSEWSPEEIKENIVVPNGCGSIIKVRRINYKVIIDGTVTWKPSQSVILTFDGQTLPSRIFICYNSLPVELYIFPTIQCYNCCRYGHTKSICRSKPRCYKCGQDHSGETCNVEEDGASCIMCSGLHFANNKNCPEYNRQKLIKLTMAQKNLSYGEALKLHPQVKKPYAEVLNTSTLQGSPKHSLQNTNINTSHKKTVFKKPRSPPKSSQGYDRAAHEALIKECQMPTPDNGCAYKISPSNDTQNGAIMEIILALINLLQQGKTLRPSNVALLNKIINNTIKNNGFEHSTLELQEHSS